MTQETKFPKFKVCYYAPNPLDRVSESTYVIVAQNEEELRIADAMEAQIVSHVIQDWTPFSTP